MTQRETANTLLAQKVILEALAEADRVARDAALAGDFKQVGERGVGILGDSDDAPALGTVQTNAGRKGSWKVTDPAMFLAWVKATRPDEVVTSESVRSSYTVAVLGGLTRDGGVVDEGTGELSVPPGCALSNPGRPILQVKPSPEARELVFDALGLDTARLLGLARPELAGAPHDPGTTPTGGSVANSAGDLPPASSPSPGLQGQRDPKVWGGEPAQEPGPKMISPRQRTLMHIEFQRLGYTTNDPEDRAARLAMTALLLDLDGPPASSNDLTHVAAGRLITLLKEFDGHESLMAWLADQARQ